MGKGRWLADRRTAISGELTVVGPYPTVFRGYPTVLPGIWTPIGVSEHQSIEGRNGFFFVGQFFCTVFWVPDLAPPPGRAGGVHAVGAKAVVCDICQPAGLAFADAHAVLFRQWADGVGLMLTVNWCSSVAMCCFH